MVPLFGHSFVLLGLLWCLLSFQPLMAQLVSLPCSEQGDLRCSATNEVCGVQVNSDNESSNEKSSEICFACQSGFVRLVRSNTTTTTIAASPCIEIDTALTMEDYLKVFPDPVFGTKEVSLEDRLQNLKRVARLVSETNRRQPDPPYRLTLNEFSAETEQEGKQRNGFLGQQSDDEEDDTDRIPSFSFNHDSGDDLANAIDWVQAGMVSPVKNQVACGCCWSVAAIGAIESRYTIDNIQNNVTTTSNDGSSSPPNFSFQQLISCDKDNSGCNGGRTTRALQYAHENSFGGVVTRSDYPYEDRKGQTTEICKLSGLTPAYQPPEARMVVRSRDNLGFDERLRRMKEGIQEQPVAVTMKANCDLIKSYDSGVLTEDGGCACSKPNCLDHAVLMVGYNDTHNPPYLLIKNSWGTLYGEEGYFRVAQTAKGDFGLFGLLSEGAFPSTNTDFEEAKNPLELWHVILIGVSIALVLSAILFAFEKWWRGFLSRQAPVAKEEEAAGGDEQAQQDVHE